MIKKLHFVTYGFLLLFLFFGSQLKAQDPHFSQAINAPVLLNPALTGVMGSDARVQMNYRSQWSSLATPYRTMALAMDFSPMRYIFNTDDILGIGAYIMRDKAGISELSNTQIHASLAYSKSLNGQGNNYLSIGGQVGYASQNINLNALTFDNQIQGNVLNSSLPSGENFLLSNSNYWDISAGIGWAYTPEKSQSYYFGLSIHHLNEPRIGFMEDDLELLYRRYTAYAGVEFRVNYLISMMPRAFLLQQGAAREITMGNLVKFNLESGRNRYDSSAFMLGLLYRVQDALIMVARYDFKTFGVSFSYDVNVSSLRITSNGYGAMEVALFYKTQLSSQKRRGRPVLCPNF